MSVYCLFIETSKQSSHAVQKKNMNKSGICGDLETSKAWLQLPYIIMFKLTDLLDMLNICGDLKCPPPTPPKKIMF